MTAALLRELDGLVEGDRYFLSERIAKLPGSGGSAPPHTITSRSSKARNP
jgi:hypothetical protein